MLACSWSKSVAESSRIALRSVTVARIAPIHDHSCPAGAKSSMVRLHHCECRYFRVGQGQGLEDAGLRSEIEPNGHKVEMKALASAPPAIPSPMVGKPVERSARHPSHMLKNVDKLTRAERHKFCKISRMTCSFCIRC